MAKTAVLNKLKKYVDELIKQKLPVEYVLLFGSQVTGKTHKDSDIDVAVVLNKIDGDFLKTASLLYKLKREIDPLIEPVLFETDHDPSGFLDQIFKTGQILYKGKYKSK